MVHYDGIICIILRIIDANQLLPKLSYKVGWDKIVLIANVLCDDVLVRGSSNRERPEAKCPMGEPIVKHLAPEYSYKSISQFEESILYTLNKLFSAFRINRRAD